MIEMLEERDTQKKPRKYPKGKIVLGICLVGLILVAYGTWQYYAQLFPSTDGTDNNPPVTGSAPNFELADINGTTFSLNQFAGRVIVINFMFVSCGGMNSTNENNLRSLKSMCATYCGKRPITIITVAATTCTGGWLLKIRADYGVTWLYGNDYADGKADVFNAYRDYDIGDGTIIIIDKNLNVAYVFNEETTFETLSSLVSQLL